jgi:hypothetical protein
VAGINVKTLDGVEIEVTHADANVPPGLKGGQYVNITAVWFRPLSGEWIRSRHRSAIVTCDAIKHSMLSEFATKIGVIDEGSEASGGRSGVDDVAKLQSSSGHSIGDADKPAAGKPEA